MPSGTQKDSVSSIAVDPQGRIVLLVGLNSSSTGLSVTGANLMRLNSNGTLDSTFGTNGLYQTGVLLSTHAMQFQAAASDPNGYQILVAGNGPMAPVGILPRDQAGISRLNSNGTLDASFGSSGTTLFAAPMDPSQAAAGDTEWVYGINSIAFETDGSIIAGGNNNLKTSSGAQFADPFVAHLSASGILDPSFGNNNGFAVYGFAPEGYQIDAISTV